MSVRVPKVLLMVLPLMGGCASVESRLGEIDAFLQGGDGKFRSSAFSPSNASSKASPLQNFVRLELPTSAVTVEDGFDHLLAGTGYTVTVSCQHCPSDAPQVAFDPISPLAYAKPGEETTVERALLMVLGHDARLVVDHQEKLISFERVKEDALI